MSLVVVEKGKSGAFWRMTYGNHVDYLDYEPTEQDKSLFIQSCVAANKRAAMGPVPGMDRHSVVEPVR